MSPHTEPAIKSEDHPAFFATSLVQEDYKIFPAFSGSMGDSAHPASFGSNYLLSPSDTATISPPSSFSSSSSYQSDSPNSPIYGNSAGFSASFPPDNFTKAANDPHRFSFSEFLNDQDSDYVSDDPSAVSAVPTAIYLDTPTTFDNATATPFGDNAVPMTVNDFPFFGAIKESPETALIPDTNAPSPLNYDLFMDLLTEHAAAVAETSCKMPMASATSDPSPSVSSSRSPDSLPRSLPGSPTSPIMNQSVYYKDVLFAKQELNSNPYSSPSPPRISPPPSLVDPTVSLRRSVTSSPPLTENLPSTFQSKPTAQGTATYRSRPKSSTSAEGDSKYSKGFECTYSNCTKSFKRLEHLKRHVRSLHTFEKPFKCQVLSCGKTFSRSDNLSQHMRTHRPLKERQAHHQRQNELAFNSFNPYMQAYNANADGMVI